MANWRRGFFRLWLLISALWLTLLGAIAVPAYMNPVLPDQFFTFNDDEQLERIEPYSDRYFQVTADADKNLYQNVSFKDDAPEVTYFAPNIMEVEVRGKTYKAAATTENTHLPEGRDGLIDTLVSFIVTQETEPQDLLTLRADVAAAVSPDLKPKYMTREIGEQVKQYAARLHQEAIDSTHEAQIRSTLIYGFVPPLVILILGAAVGWVLTGFRRAKSAGT